MEINPSSARRPLGRQPPTGRPSARTTSSAALWGALLGTLPDLDVLVPLDDAVRDFTYHRGPSHSLFVLAALTPLVVWLILKIHPQTRALRWRWALLVYAVFATHVLLDALTVYGTQIFWPLPVPPASWATIFVIDPLYTVPLLLGVLAALVLRRRTNPRGRWLNGAGLALGTLYLVWSIGAKLHVNAVVEAELARTHSPRERFITIPTPFNTLFWRVLVVGPTGYAEGYYSLLDRSRPLEFTQHPSHPELLAGLEDEWAVRRLRWFTHGFYAVGREGDRRGDHRSAHGPGTGLLLPLPGRRGPQPARRAGGLRTRLIETQLTIPSRASIHS